MWRHLFQRFRKLIQRLALGGDLEQRVQRDQIRAVVQIVHNVGRDLVEPNTQEFLDGVDLSYDLALLPSTVKTLSDLNGLSQNDPKIHTSP